MAEDNWNKATKKMVVHPAGKDVYGRPRYSRANFDLMEWEGPTGSTRETYVVPVGQASWTSIEINLAGKTDPLMVSDFGYYELSPIILENQFDQGIFEVQRFGFL